PHPPRASDLQSAAAPLPGVPGPGPVRLRTAAGRVSPELEAAVESARAAGRLQLRRFRRGQAVEQKADDTPVTATDRESEALIRRRLEAAFPRYGFLGEEGGE